MCGTSLVTQKVKNLPAMQEANPQPLGQEDLLEKEMATPLQYPCLVNPINRGAWETIIHAVATVWHDLVTEPPQLSRMYRFR